MYGPRFLAPHKKKDRTEAPSFLGIRLEWAGAVVDGGQRVEHVGAGVRAPAHDIQLAPIPPLVEVAVHGAAGDGDVLVRVDGQVAGALPVELVRQALVEEAQRLLLPWLRDPELEGVRPVPLGPVGEGEDQACGVLRHAYPDGVDGRVGFPADLQRHLPRLAAAHDGLVEAAVERHAEHVVRGHLARRRVVEQGQPLARGGRQAVAGLPVHRRPPELELRPRRQRHRHPRVLLLYGGRRRSGSGGGRANARGGAPPAGEQDSCTGRLRLPADSRGAGAATQAAAGGERGHRSVRRRP
uniref:Uncharacterized protein n=1 Tax=Zea mays TaxID=4577 RepID=C4J654_MAIZE|nr:unknown [Zea mays]